MCQLVKKTNKQKNNNKIKTLDRAAIILRGQSVRWATCLDAANLQRVSQHCIKQNETHWNKSKSLEKKFLFAADKPSPWDIHLHLCTLQLLILLDLWNQTETWLKKKNESCSVVLRVTDRSWLAAGENNKKYNHKSLDIVKRCRIEQMHTDDNLTAHILSNLSVCLQLPSHSPVLLCHYPAATQWKESARACRGGRGCSATRRAHWVSTATAAWSRACVWMAGCVTAPLAGATVPPASRSDKTPLYMTFSKGYKVLYRDFFFNNIFQGTHCESPCKSGSYGKNCSLQCSCHNFVDCSPVDGACFCKEGISLFLTPCCRTWWRP